MSSDQQVKNVENLLVHSGWTPAPDGWMVRYEVEMVRVSRTGKSFRVEFRFYPGPVLKYESSTAIGALRACSQGRHASGYTAFSMFEHDAIQRSKGEGATTLGDRYTCPSCGSEVVDVYVPDDALCCYCRDINDPHLSKRVRDGRLKAAGMREYRISHPSAGEAVFVDRTGAKARARAMRLLVEIGMCKTASDAFRGLRSVYVGPARELVGRHGAWHLKDCRVNF
jgi:hypothetical protein